MAVNRVFIRHGSRVLWFAATDSLLLMLAFVLGTYIRLPGEFLRHLEMYWGSIGVGMTVLPVVLYISGLYSRPSRHRQSRLHTVLVIVVCNLIATAAMIACFYFNFSTRIGRGVMLLGVPIAMALTTAHYLVLRQRHGQQRERVAVIVNSPFDARIAQRFFEDSRVQRHFVCSGIVTHRFVAPPSPLNVLGTVDELPELVRTHDLERVIFLARSFEPIAFSELFCQLRYSGIVVMSMSSVYEELFQSVPTSLITNEWLLHASESPHLFYIKKLKRAFDVIASLLLLFLSLPLLLVGIVIVRFTSDGPAIYRQIRCGRWGQEFQILKLRTMRCDAESDGAKWSNAGDTRVTIVGRVLRRFRIDELPQLINILRGDMSFVGPRPERPEFIAELTREIPCYRERLMVLPGLTGWAQVNYPYGASTTDSRRKLEYDLYYMKHMSLFLDFLIVLDTIRTVLWGARAEDEQLTVESGEDVRFEEEPRLYHVATDRHDRSS